VFIIPITVPVRFDDEIHRISVSVEIDKIAVVKPLLDIQGNIGVELNQHSTYAPLTELLLVDGRKLPVCEPPAIINRYLDAYRSIEEFYTAPRSVETGLDKAAPEGDRGVVIPLFGARPPCASSQGSTPV
jgi:hypothetical protein